MQANKLIEHFAARLVAAKRMDRNRRIQSLRLFVQRIEFRAAEVFAVRLRGQHAAAKPKLGDRAIELLGALGRIVHRQIGHRLQARRRLAVIRDEIVIGPAKRQLKLRVAHPANTQTAGRKHHRGVDLLGVHRLQPLLDFGAALAQRAAEIAVVMLTRNKRRFLIPIGLGQVV